MLTGGLVAVVVMIVVRRLTADLSDDLRSGKRMSIILPQRLLFDQSLDDESDSSLWASSETAPGVESHGTTGDQGNADPDEDEDE